MKKIPYDKLSKRLTIFSAASIGRMCDCIGRMCDCIGRMCDCERLGC
jgi:hypothetical protein